MAVTSPSDYKKINNSEKEIKLPSGAVFLIRKLALHECIELNVINLETEDTIKAKNDQYTQQNKLEKPKISNKEYEDLINKQNKLIIRSVVNPIISENPSNDSLWINDISLEDYTFLVKEIRDFLLMGGQDLKPFRDDTNRPNSGSSRAKVQQTTK